MRKILFAVLFLTSMSAMAESMTYFSDGSYARTQGDSTYFSDGSYAKTQGNSTYYSDGSYSTTY